uniref:Uncharacterized protein n=1 Tax=Megaselia scalaris TaxID=36166 RepID=T1GHT6_MEGSC
MNSRLYIRMWMLWIGDVADCSTLSPAPPTGNDDFLPFGTGIFDFFPGLGLATAFDEADLFPEHSATLRPPPISTPLHVGGGKDVQEYIINRLNCDFKELVEMASFDDQINVQKKDHLTVHCRKKVYQRCEVDCRGTIFLATVANSDYRRTKFL